MCALFLSFGLLALVAYRSFARHESPWDLLALVILAGGVRTAYQGSIGSSAGTGWPCPSWARCSPALWLLSWMRV